MFFQYKRDFLSDQLAVLSYSQRAHACGQRYNKEVECFETIVSLAPICSSFTKESVFVHFVSVRKMVEECIMKFICFKRLGSYKAAAYLIDGQNTINELERKIHRFLGSSVLFGISKLVFERLLATAQIYQLVFEALTRPVVNTTPEFMQKVEALAPHLCNSNHHMNAFMKLFIRNNGYSIDHYTTEMDIVKATFDLEARCPSFSLFVDVALSHFILLVTLLNLSDVGEQFLSKAVDYCSTNYDGRRHIFLNQCLKILRNECKSLRIVAIPHHDHFNTLINVNSILETNEFYPELLRAGVDSSLYHYQ